MTKKRYYSLIDEYNSIIEHKHFNKDFYDAEKLTSIKSKMLVYFRKKKLDISSYVMHITYIDKDNAVKFRNIYDNYDLMSRLMIENASIPKSIYNNTYINFNFLHIAVTIIVILLYTLFLLLF